ncbi:MAG: hypothetical protein IJ272_06610 [Clostridia bacterium]|nr:hypothetical protein [Clostridia bacterium]
MLDYESQRKLIIVFILAAILTVIITIVVLVFIWIPDNVAEAEQQFEVGKIEQQSSTEEAVVEKYYKQLYVMFRNNDLDEIYNLVGQDYLKYFNYDKQDIIDFLRRKSVLTKGLELAQYKSFLLDGYSNVYELDLKAKDEAYAINIVIREKSPNDYTITFDKFIDYKENDYTFTKDSIKLNIDKKIRYTNSVQYDFKLTNSYNKEIKVNSGASGNPIILVNSQKETRRPVMTTLAVSEITMQPGEGRSFTAVFDIEDTYDYVTYSTLVIKNIQFAGIQGTDNLEFKLD